MPTRTSFADTPGALAPGTAVLVDVSASGIQRVGAAGRGAVAAARAAPARPSPPGIRAADGGRRPGRRRMVRLGVLPGRWRPDSRRGGPRPAGPARRAA